MSEFTTKAIVFDLDGTLTNIVSPWKMVHQHYGVWERAVVYHDQFFKGEFDYDTWCRKDSSLWEDRDYNEVCDLIDSIEPTAEAIEVLQKVASYNNNGSAQIRMMILSSGFVSVARKTIKMAGLDEDRVKIIANDIQQINGKIQGVPNVKLGSAEHGKSAHIKRFLTQNSIKPECAIAVDDRDEDRDLYKNFGAFIHIKTPSDLYQIYNYLG